MQQQKVVMIIDDDEDQLFIYETMLKIEGFEVIAVRTAQEGLETLRQLHVDIVVCDLMMPAMCGREFIKRVREKNRGLKNLPVISFSSASSEIEPEVVKAGADSFFSKSAPKEKLISQIVALTNNAESRELLSSIQKRFS